MSTIKFAPEELDEIKVIQDKYNVIGIQLVQLKLAIKNTQTYLQSLQQQESTLEDEIVQTNTEEKALAEKLDSKYGAGSLDLETGQFTPKA
jgi:hypothetical protein